jgi:hypothetical protein
MAASGVGKFQAIAETTTGMWDRTKKVRMPEQSQQSSVFRKLVEGEVTVDEYVADVKRRVEETRRVVSHGVSGYQRGCRCDDCRSAWRDYHREWMRSHPEHARKHADRENARYHASKASNQESRPEGRPS